MWPILLGESSNPSSLELLDVFGDAVHTFAYRNAEVGKLPVVLFVPVWNQVEDFFVSPNPHLQVFDALLIAMPLLRVICIALLHGDGEATCDSLQHVGVDVMMAVKEREH